MLLSVTALYFLHKYYPNICFVRPMTQDLTLLTASSDLSSLSDHELVENCKFELPYESRSFRVLMDRYQNKVMAKAESMLNNVEDAKDMTQEIFIKVYNNLPRFAMKAKFSTWLYIITVNSCLSLIDKRQRSPQWWLTEELDDSFVEKEESEIFTILGKGIEREGAMECIEETLQEIDDGHRSVLQLRFLEELNYQAIADRLKIGLSAMKMRLKRAREEFREQFEAQCLGSAE